MMEMTEDQHELYEERAAIMQYDGGCTQEEAKTMAWMHWEEGKL